MSETAMEFLQKNFNLIMLLVSAVFVLTFVFKILPVVFGIASFVLIFAAFFVAQIVNVSRVAKKRKSEEEEED